MARRNFSEEEKKVQGFWKENQIFEKSVERDAPNGDYVFYDGPPFATGTPHYGHIIASVLKDVVPRYWTMKGYRVERKWGWDCHGLPVENLVEKDLGVNSKKEIEEQVGIKKFNDSCHSKVMMYAEEWKSVIGRLGRFVDMENDYKTMDLEYMESIWWVFKQLWDKDLIYKDYRSMHICPRCETTLSHSEISQGYEDVKDLSVTAEFKLVDEPNTSILAWTTTPWTLPGNVALAVGADVDYVVVEKKDEGAGELVRFVVAKDLLEKIFGDQEYKVVQELKGSELVGKKYQPLFPYYENSDLENKENMYTVIAEDFVTTEDGTGVVHIAPGFGEDDFQAGKRHSLPFIQHVGADGRYKDEVADWPGREVKPKDDPMGTDIEIVKYLAAHGTLFAKEKYEHSYPHCWRCDSPLLNYSTSSWFVAVTKIKDRMLEHAKEINWVPSHIKEGRFGNWLEGARDWAISRQRFWGSVMPIWECEKADCFEQKVLGSIAELEELTGEKVTDLHKHIVDEYKIQCSCGGIMKRIPDVLDCWFEAGSMPYAQMHYPFENEQKFLNNFPAKFIAEGVDQTRAWFYYLHVLGTALCDKPAFENVIVNGILLAEDGKKMSKRLRNYPDPVEVMETYGSDAMRLYLMNSPAVQADDLRFSEKGVDEVFKKVMMIWWNVFSFYEMYAGDDNVIPDEQKQDPESQHILDKWVLARLNQFTEQVTQYMDGYDLLKASRLFVEFINDVSTWYVRRSRDRFKVDGDDKQAALQTLHEVLLTASKVMCPFIPFITEDIYLRLKNKSVTSGSDSMPESIHLCKWPQAQEYDQKVLDDMAQARAMVELVLSLRSTHGVKIRQALSEVQVTGLDISDAMKEILKDELNVKDITCLSSRTEQSGDAGSLPQGEHWLTNQGSHMEVALNSEITHELKLEGIARELIRHINLLRKQQGFTIDDKASLEFSTTDSEIQETFKVHADILLAGTQCTKISVGASEGDEVKVNGEVVVLKITKV